MSDTDFLGIIGLVLSCTSGKSSVEFLESTGSTGSVLFVVLSAHRVKGHQDACRNTK